MKKSINALFFCLVTLSQSAYSDVKLLPLEVSSNILISGVIKNGDEDRFKDYASKNKISYILLTSKGGSVDAAISIGRQIRQLPEPVPQVVVPDGKECISSCVLVLAGGLKRAVWQPGGKIGIHRPFLLDDDNISMEQQKKEYRRIEKKIKEYLEEVNVPVSLYDTMFRIPPSQVRYLTDKEMQDFNLNEADPYYREARDAKFAKNMGMTKHEYLKYNAEVNEKCSKYFPPDEELMKLSQEEISKLANDSWDCMSRIDNKYNSK